MGKRDYGQGSLRQKPNGKWLARYWGPDGKQHAKTFDRKADAQAWLDEAKVEQRRGSWIDPGAANTLFADWAEEWARSRRHGLEASGWQRDESHLKNHIMPTFGTRRLGSIGALDVRVWINDLVAKGLAPRTVGDVHRIFGAIMRSAVAAKMIGEAPVGRGVVTLPKVVRKVERFLTGPELENLVLQFHPFYRPLIYTAAYTGCRWQELNGLVRTNLDLKARVLHVRTVTQRDRGKVNLREYPKTDAGRRTIRLPLRLVEVLTFHLAAAPASELDLVFPGAEGRIMGESGFRQRHFKPAAERAGVLPFTFHDLRHTHVAWLIEDGAQPLVVQRRLGHKDIATTMNIYGHLFPNAEDDLVEDLDRRWTTAATNVTQTPAASGGGTVR